MIAAWSLHEIEAKVIETARDVGDIPADRIGPDSRLVEDLGMDSLEVVEFIMSLEETFDIEIPDELPAQFFKGQPSTINGVARMVQTLLGTRAPARPEWTDPREPFAIAELASFTQLGGRPSPRTLTGEPLYEHMGSNREGYEQYRRRTDGMRCVLIPAAEVWIGRNDEDALPDQKPAHRVCLPEFLMDAEPVSVTAFSRFLNAVGAPANIVSEWCGTGPEDDRAPFFPVIRKRGEWNPIEGTEHQPVVLVSWFGANAYSLWANRGDWRLYRDAGNAGFLPSEAQWEYAARGPIAEKSPWRETENRESVTGLHRAGQSYDPDSLPAAPVNAYFGMSPFGLHHMGGNVWNWCAEWYDPAFQERHDAGAANCTPTGLRSERGGSWVGPERLSHPCYRSARPPAARGRCLGFRCIGYRGSFSGSA